MRVLLPFDPAELEVSLPDGVEVRVWPGEGPLPEGVANTEVYVVPYLGGRERFTAIEAMPHLQVIQTMSAGFDHVLPFLPDGVVLCSARGVHDTSTAELAVALILASERGLPQFVHAQARGEWDQEFLTGLADSTVLIVGFGSIGEALHRRLAGFEVEILRVARTARDGVQAMESLPELLPKADVVVLTLPLTDATRGMVDAAFLARMRDGALLVNVARGPVVVTEDLLVELGSGRLRAALDVTDPEPLPSGHPLWGAPNLLLTPHIGGGTAAFRPRVNALILDQLHRLARGEAPRNQVTGAY